MQTDNSTITPEALKKILDDKAPVQIIDVREPEEHEKYNIGGKLIPVVELPRRLNEINKEKKTIVYCEVGMRSARAVYQLRARGYENVFSLKGGLKAWRTMLDL